MTRIACSVAGCPGKVDVEVINSRVVESPCPFCVRRGIWAVSELTSARPMICTICTGTMAPRPNGKPRKYCEACVPLAARLRWQNCNAKRARTGRAA